MIVLSMRKSTLFSVLLFCVVLISLVLVHGLLVKMTCSIISSFTVGNRKSMINFSIGCAISI